MDKYHIENMCCDFVADRKYEPLVIDLLHNHDAVAWMDINAAAERWKITLDSAGSYLGCWMLDPAGNKGYAMILVYEQTTWHHMLARYNAERILPNGWLTG